MTKQILMKSYHRVTSPKSPKVGPPLMFALSFTHLAVGGAPNGRTVVAIGKVEKRRK